MKIPPDMADFLKVLSSDKVNQSVLWGVFGEGVPGCRPGHTLIVAFTDGSGNSRTAKLVSSFGAHKQWSLTMMRLDKKGNPSEDALVSLWNQEGALLHATRVFSDFHVKQDPMNFTIFADKTQDLFPAANEEAEEAVIAELVEILEKFRSEARVNLTGSSLPEVRKIPI